MRGPAFALLLLLAGCAAPRPSPFVADDCDPSGAGAINQDAPILDVFADPLELARATARGLGERWLDDTPDHVWEETSRWDTGDGAISVTLADGIGVEVSSTRAASFSEEALRSLGRALGVTEAGAYSTYGQTRQSWLGWNWPTHRHQGSIAASSPGSSGQGYVTFHAIHSLVAAHVVVPEETAIATATAYARCDLDRDGKGEAAGYRFSSVGERTSFEPFGDAFTFVVTVWFTEPAGKESHCGLSRQVAIDAVTGAVVGEPIVYCD